MKSHLKTALVMIISVMMLCSTTGCSKKATGTKRMKSNCGCPHF
jgi:hypothetical protein